MLSEMNLVKRFLGAKFGYGEPLKDGVYAVPTETSKGAAFMKMEIENGSPSGNDNFSLFWDEQLNISWYETKKPDSLEESEYSKCFRKLESLHP